MEVRNYITKRCPVCGIEYKYPDCAYKPPTCSDKDCVLAYSHHPERYIDLMTYADKQRVEAGL